MDKLMPFLSKILAPFVVGALAWAANKTGIVELNTQETAGTVTALIVYAATSLTSVFISKKTNPSNAATTQLAVVDKARNEELKSEEKLEAAKV